MDNAAKALIFAGGILIAILVISVSIYVIGEARGVARASNEKLEANAVQSFNRFYVSFGDTVSGIDALNIYRKAVDDKAREAANHPIETINAPASIIAASNLIDGTSEDVDWAKNLKTTYEFSYERDIDGYIYKVFISE